MTVLLAAFVSALCQQEVAPPEAASAQSIALPALVERLLPAEGADALSATSSEAPVLWLDPPPSPRDPRIGLARVTVTGRTSTVQDRGTRELAWSVTAGSDLIKIEPGTPQLYCFGSTYTGCSFTAEEAFAGSSLSLRQLCTDDFGGFSRVTVYEATAPGRRGFIRYSLSGDAEGANAWLEISLTQLPCEI